MAAAPKVFIQDMATIIINQAPEELTQGVAYSYWKGRSWQQLGAAEAASQAFEQAAKERQYYGFLASARLQQPPSLNHQNLDWPRWGCLLTFHHVQDARHQRSFPYRQLLSR